MSKTAVVDIDSTFGKLKCFSLLDAMILDANTIKEDIVKKNISLKSNLKKNILPIIHTYVCDNYDADEPDTLIVTEFQPLELKNTEFENDKLMLELTFEFTPNTEITEKDEYGFIERNIYHRIDINDISVITNNILNPDIHTPDDVDTYVSVTSVLSTEPPYNSSSIPGTYMQIHSGVISPSGSDINYHSRIDFRYKVLLNDKIVCVCNAETPSEFGLMLNFPIPNLPKTGTNNIKVLKTNDPIESTKWLSIGSHVRGNRHIIDKLTVEYNGKTRYNTGGTYSYGAPWNKFINNEEITTDIVCTVEFNSNYFEYNKDYEDTVEILYNVDTIHDMIHDHTDFCHLILLILGRGEELENEPNVRRVVRYVIPRDKILQLVKYTNSSRYGVFNLTFNSTILKKK